jgi:hypothetical protein
MKMIEEGPTPAIHGVVRGLIRMRNIQKVAKLGEEKSIIGAFLSAFAIGPARDEGFQIGGGLCCVYSLVSLVILAQITCRAIGQRASQW